MVATQIFSFSPRTFGEDEPNLTVAYVSDGLVNNHQPDLFVEVWGHVDLGYPPPKMMAQGEHLSPQCFVLCSYGFPQVFAHYLPTSQTPKPHTIYGAMVYLPTFYHTNQSCNVGKYTISTWISWMSKGNIGYPWEGTIAVVPQTFPYIGQYNHYRIHI